MAAVVVIIGCRFLSLLVPRTQEANDQDARDDAGHGAGEQHKEMRRVVLLVGNYVAGVDSAALVIM